MPALNISKSIEIEAPVDKVYGIVSDFHHWQPWSPWLIMDHNVKLDIAEDGKYYNWDGDLTGAGEMTVTHETPNESIDYDLTFLKPWKSKAKIRFETKDLGDKTKVTWIMDSSLPFFLFWMKKTMTAALGMDYDRGLAMLKDYAETGVVPSQLDFKGESEFPGCTYVGIRTACTQDDVGPKMQEDLGKLHEYLKDKEDLPNGVPFSIYHKWDIAKGKVEYTSGVPVKEVPTDLPESFITSTIPPTKIYTLNHIGNYHHLGNAWSTMYSMKQNKKIKLARGIHPFETYDSDPTQTNPKDLVTGIHFAVK